MNQHLLTQLSYLEHELFQQAFDAILIANDDAEYVHANPAACDLLGMPHSALIGSRVFAFKPDEAREVVRVQWKAFLDQGEQSGIFDIHRPDGSVQRCAFRAKANFLPGFHLSVLSPLASIDEVLHPTEKNLITMCAWSKRIKVNERWITIEEFLSRHLKLRISHGICPEAEERLFGG